MAIWDEIEDFGKELWEQTDDTLFGTETRVKEQSKPTILPEQREQLNNVFDMFNRNINRLGGAKRLPSDTSRNEDAILNQIFRTATGEGGGISGKLFDSAEGALMSLMASGGRTGGDFDEFFKTTVQDPLVKSFEEDIIPRIGRQFGGNFFGSERIGASFDAFQDLTDTLVESRANLAESSRRFDTDALLRSVGMAPSIAGIPGQEIQAMSQALEAAGLPRDVLTKAIQGDNASLIALQSILGQLSTAPLQENIHTVIPGRRGAVDSFLQGAGDSIGDALGNLFK